MIMVTPEQRRQRMLVNAVAEHGENNIAGVSAYNDALEKDLPAAITIIPDGTWTRLLRADYAGEMEKQGIGAEPAHESEYKLGSKAGGGNERMPDSDAGDDPAPAANKHRGVMDAAATMARSHPWAWRINTPLGRLPELDLPKVRAMARRTGIVSGYFHWLIDKMGDQKEGVTVAEVILDSEMRQAAQEAYLGLEMFIKKGERDAR